MLEDGLVSVFVDQMPFFSFLEGGGNQTKKRTGSEANCKIACRAEMTAERGSWALERRSGARSGLCGTWCLICGWGWCPKR